jgi:hypothetical protein
MEGKMNRLAVALLAACFAPSLYADVAQHLVPAGSLIGCTISEPRLSSKTAAVGDPVLCQISRSERYGRTVLPSNSFLVGRFEDYKDPGHFVGKGWMELRFDRMVIEPDTILSVDVRVVDVPGYHVDNQGRILGKGHVGRDIAMWSIPILWPIDLLTIADRGPRPTLKQETRITLKVMDDLTVPTTTTPQQDPYGLTHREPSAKNNTPSVPSTESSPVQEPVYSVQQEVQQPQPVMYVYYPVPYPPQPVPVVVAYAPMMVAPQPTYVYAPSAYGYPAGARAYGYAAPGRVVASYYGRGPVVMARARYAYPR